ncbi:TPA: hypothetical protein ACGPAJ_001675, partial [Streptococcus suis]
FTHNGQCLRIGFFSFLVVHHAPPCQNLISFRLPKMANTSLFLLIQPSLNLIIFIHLTFRIIQRSDIRRFEKSKNVPYFCTLSTLWMLDGTSFLAPNRSAFICFVKRTFVVFVRFGNAKVLHLDNPLSQ